MATAHAYAGTQPSGTGGLALSPVCSIDRASYPRHDHDFVQRRVVCAPLFPFARLGTWPEINPLLPLSTIDITMHSAVPLRSGISPALEPYKTRSGKCSGHDGAMKQIKSALVATHVRRSAAIQAHVAWKIDGLGAALKAIALRIHRASLLCRRPCKQGQEKCACITQLRVRAFPVQNTRGDRCPIT